MTGDMRLFWVSISSPFVARPFAMNFLLQFAALLAVAAASPVLVASQEDMHNAAFDTAAPGVRQAGDSEVQTL